MNKMEMFVEDYLTFKRIWCNRDDNPKDISDEVCLRAYRIYMEQVA